jgi:hypothetical protein
MRRSHGRTRENLLQYCVKRSYISMRLPLDCFFSRRLDHSLTEPPPGQAEVICRPGAYISRPAP